MSLKRVLENKAGNLQSFGRGMSYLAEAAPVPDMAAQDKAQDKAQPQATPSPSLTALVRLSLLMRRVSGGPRP